MTTSSGIRVRILGDDSDLQNKLRSSATAVAKWGAAAAAAAAAGGAALVRSGLQSADAQAKLARGLGATTEGLGALQRAAGRAGVSTSELESATLRLNQRLGQAVTEGGKAGETLDALGLSAQALSDMDVDERMAAISDAMRGAGLSSQEMAFHLRNLGIRQSAIVNLMQEGGDAIRESRDRIAAYGLALNDVDAAKVEAANDAMEEGSVVMRGLTQQLAVQFAPVLQGIADLMADAAAETGGLGSVAERTFNIVMTGAAFAADAVEGVRRVFLLAGQAAATFALQTVKMMTEATESIMGGPVRAVNALIEQMNRIPRVEIPTLDQPDMVQGMQRDIDMLEGAVAEGMEAMQRTLMEPMPSESIKDWMASVQDAAEVAARAAVEAREGLSMPGIDDDEDTSEADAKAAEDLAKLQDRLNDRMEVIRRSLMDERELEVTEHWDRMNEIDEARDAGVLSLEEHQRMERELSEQHQDRLTAIDRAGISARVDLLSRGLGNMASLMQTENRKLFEIGKAAAIGQAIVDGIASTVSSYKYGAGIGGPVVGAAFAATAATATGVQIAKLASTSMGGGGSVSAPPSGAPAVPNLPEQQQRREVNLNLSLQGDRFTRDQVAGLGREMVEEINNALDDGAQLRLSGA